MRRRSNRRGLPRRSRLLINAVTVAVTVLFSYIALSGINLSEVWHALRTSDYLWLIPALIAFGLGNVARGLRWRSLFAPGRRPPRGSVINATMIGYFYNSILPARAGEAARVLVLNQRSSTPAIEIIGTVVIERLYDLIAILVIFFAAEPWLPHVSWFGAAAVAAIVLAGLIVAAVVVLAVYGDRPLRLLLRPLRRFSAVLRRAPGAHDRRAQPRPLRPAPRHRRAGSLPLDARRLDALGAVRLLRQRRLPPAPALRLRRARRRGDRPLDDPALAARRDRRVRGRGADRAESLWRAPLAWRCPTRSSCTRSTLFRSSSSASLLLQYNARHPGPKGALSLEVAGGGWLVTESMFGSRRGSSSARPERRCAGLVPGLGSTGRSMSTPAGTSSLSGGAARRRHTAQPLAELRASTARRHK